MTAPIQVLVVDDSAVVRGLLVRALESDPDIRVAGTAMHGEAALSVMRQRPVDVVVLDVEMPVMDGLTALTRILELYPRTRVIMASTLTYDGAETTVQALARGAAGCIAKPVVANAAAGIEQLSRDLLPLVKALATKGPAAASPRAKAPVWRSPPSLVVIGTSTGGPNALSRVIKDLSSDFPLPILIVQHMPPTFTPMLAKHLERDGGRPCAEARDGEPIERGRTYVAPGDFHLFIDKRGDRMVTCLNRAPPEHYCRPSVNPLFRSAATWYGSQTLAVMLTGMGDDGIEGTRDIAARRGTIIAQDEASSVVWGMPGAVVREQLAHEVLPLDQIAPAIARTCLQEAVCR